MTKRPSAAVLVAAIGNPDRGDDGVGPAVAARLRGRAPAAARIIESGGDVLALIEEWREFAAVIVVDAAAPLGRPGRIHRLDLIARALPESLARASTHAFGLAEAVALARSLGRLPARLIAYLVEGRDFAIGTPLSPAVTAAVDTLAARILAELQGAAAPQAAAVDASPSR